MQEAKPTNELKLGNWKLQLMETATGEEAVNLISPKGKSVLLHSAIDPIKEAKTLVNSIDTSKNSLYIVFGTGAGHHLQVLKHKITPSSRVIVLEPFEEFINFSKTNDIHKKINDKRFCFIGGSLNQIILTLDKLLYKENLMLSSNIRFLVLPAYNRLFGDWVKKLQKQSIDLIKNRLFEMGNDVADTLQGIKQTMDNIEELAASPNTEDLKGAYQNTPAIIVSAGPSLNKNVDLLKQVRGKALILCVDASLNVLLKKGIVPDAVFSIERGIETYNQFFKNKKLPSEPVLIGPPVIWPKIYKEYPGERAVFLRENEGVSIWLDQIVKKGKVKMGSSVAHLAFGFAQLVKADPIIFIGQDLAYSPDGYSHGDGVSVNKKQDLSKVETWVDGYNGEKLPSTRVWKNFLTWFEKEIADTDARCIDATEGGALIKGSQIMTLKDAIQKYIKDMNPIPSLQKLIKQKKSNISSTQDLKLVLEKFEKLISFFNELAQKAEAGIDRLERIQKKTDFDGLNKRKLIKVIDKMRKNEKVVKMILSNKVAVMCFQTMIFLANTKLNQLGDRVTPENVQKNIQIQHWFLDRVWRVSLKVEEELKKILYTTKLRLQ